MPPNKTFYRLKAQVHRAHVNFTKERRGREQREQNLLEDWHEQEEPHEDEGHQRDGKDNVRVQLVVLSSCKHTERERDMHVMATDKKNEETAGGDSLGPMYS